MENISYLTSLAFRFGPFLFALLFTLFVSRWAYNNYNKANLRTNPPASDSEINTLRSYFLGAAVVSVILVGLSVKFWFDYQSSFHVFKGTITNLKEYEKITSNDLYLKATMIRPLEKGLPQIRDEHFICIQNKPFENDQRFKIYYSKGQGRVEEFIINYSSYPIVEYCVEWDEISGKNILKCSNPSNHSFFFLNSAYAQQEKLDLYKEKFQPESFRIDTYLIELLQEERTDIGQKIEALDRLSNFPDSQLRDYLEIQTFKEPMTLTLLDLSRHTDKELAYKAKKLINDRFKFDDYLRQKLISSSTNKNEAIKLLFRIEKERAVRILNEIPSSSKKSWMNNTLTKIKSGEKTKVLYPTGSSKGDRYYVHAKWDYKNKEVLECLTTLFYRELIHNRTYDEEVKLMKGKDNKRSDRWVYWYSKEWALYIAEKIENCGGRASFVPIRY
ncbi:MAG: hypothetical protein GF353_05130 [Candidatus Lokiarchaeota archaeon]|nr:hypothetical protein [Candidatus Lokiarchaeota archaeon]